MYELCVAWKVMCLVVINPIMLSRTGICFYLEFGKYSESMPVLAMLAA